MLYNEVFVKLSFLWRRIRRRVTLPSLVFRACSDISVYSAVQTVKLIFSDRFAIFISSLVRGLPPSERHACMASAHFETSVHKTSEIFQREREREREREKKKIPY